MIRLPAILERHGSRVLFLGEGIQVTYAQFGRMIREAGAEWTGSDRPLALRLEWNPESFARLLACFEIRRDVFLGDPLPAGDLQPFRAHRPLLLLRTGGTTGAPRHVVHSAERLLCSYQLQDRPPVRILVLYAAPHIAGLDAFFQALHRGSTLVVPPGRDPQSVAHAIEHYQAEVLPATPTFLQFLLLSGSLDGRKVGSVRAIPHGAEPMPPALRQRLKIVFPHARLIHRFGLTELGALPVKPDPEDPDALFLEEARHAWEIRDGELWIQSPTRMLGTLEEGALGEESSWHATGDLAEETRRGSIRILGRREAMINVGGEKILPETVEGLLLEQEGVRDAAVHGAPNPLTGQAVVARVVYAGEPDPTGLLRALRRAVRERGLSLAHVPTRIEPAQTLLKTPMGKRSRVQGKA